MWEKIYKMKSTKGCLFLTRTALFLKTTNKTKLCNETYKPDSFSTIQGNLP